MYIEPNSNIKIYKNVPLDNTYNHTLYFGSLSEQNAYFHGSSSILKYNLTSQSYQRVVKGSMRVEIKADNLYDCNYIAFQNTNFGIKWFYAFITSVEYINNVTSEITFEIDVMQTYLFDVTLKDCFVEREHSITDNIGENFQNEPALCDFIYDIADTTTILENSSDNKRYLLLANATNDITTPSVNRYWINNTEFYGYADIGTGDYIKEIVELYTSNGTTDRIIGIYKVISDFCKISITAPQGIQDKFSTLGLSYSESINGYTPKNKKCLQFPFQKIVLSNNKGNNIDLAFELFNEPTKCVFRVIGDLGLNDSLICTPYNYRGLSNYWDIAIENKAQLNVPYKENLFSLSDVTNGLTSVINGATTGAVAGTLIGGVGGGVGALLGGMKGGLSFLDTIGQKAIFGYPEAINVKNTDTLNNAYVDYFTAYSEQVKYDIVKTYDEFFSVYGYSTNKIKIPNISSRPHWNYVKTKYCNLIGNAPREAVEKIINIYNVGITFWKKPSEVGNYSLDNTPV